MSVLDRATGYLKLLTRSITRPHVVEIEGVRVSVSDRLSRGMRRVLYQGKYERRELRAVRANLEPSDVVLELGTGLGVISSCCAKTVGSDRVFTFEANPDLEPLIKDTYRLNRVSPELRMCMLGPAQGEQRFFIEKDIWSSSIIRRSPDAREIQIPVRDIKEVLATVNPTVLVVDIEGGEFDLLPHIHFGRVAKIFIELHPRVIGPDKTAAVRSRLLDSGFAIDRIWSNDDHLVLRRIVAARTS